MDTVTEADMAIAMAVSWVPGWGPRAEGTAWGRLGIWRKWNQR